MGTFPVVKASTERLELREYGPGDAALVREVIEAGGSPDGLPPGAPASLADVDWWLAEGVPQTRENGVVHLMMLDRETGLLVGSIGMFHVDWDARSTEIGYGVRPDRRRRGYASEALAGVARWALTEGGMQRVWLTANTDNIASLRTAEKAGFTHEGTMRRAALEDDGPHDLALYSLLDDD